MLSSKRVKHLPWGRFGAIHLAFHLGFTWPFAYFGWTDWSPPGLPGGGITGMGPPGGVGCLISGSTCSGGQITPPERASLSLRFPVESFRGRSTSLPRPIVDGVSVFAHAFGSS